MMYFEASRTYNSSNWQYIKIPDEILFRRYDWVDLNLPIEKERCRFTKEILPWAHTNDIKRLFLLSRTFPSKEQALAWMDKHLHDVLLPVHISLIQTFCYSKSTIPESITELIDKSEEEKLLTFIQKVLDRSLLWYDPDYSYPSDFVYILWEANELLRTGIKYPLKWVANPGLNGYSLASFLEYVHVFYKYENLVKGIIKGELYYEIKDLAKQAHVTLLKSISLFFEESYKLTLFGEENWERQLNEIVLKETEWCKWQIQNRLT